VLRVRVDDGNAFWESDEDNDARLFPVDIAAGPMPDIVVAALTWTPAAPRPGDALVLHVALANRGNGTSPAATLNVGLEGQEADDILVPELAPGEHREFDAPPRVMPEGAQAAWAAVSGVNETDLGNDRIAMRILADPPAPLPDLVPFFAAEPAQPASGDAVA